MLHSNTSQNLTATVVWLNEL